MKNILAAGLVAVALTACGVRGSDDAAPEASIGAADAARVEAHMAYLADDALEGREAGTPGYDMAAAYVAGQMEEIGLTPAGIGGTYFQNVPLRRSLRNADSVVMTVTGEDGVQLDLTEYSDWLVFGSTSREISDVTAPAVFAGFGIVAPKEGRDDYAGLDVEGKIVVLFSGTPKGIQTEERAYYGTRKGQFASERGAVGIVTIETPSQAARYGFERVVRERYADAASMSWLTPEGSSFTLAPNIEASGYLSLSGGETFMTAAGQDWDALIEVAEAAGGAVPTFDLPFEISLAQSSALETIESPNVAGMIVGSDPELADEVIVLTAHLDHIGLSQSMEDDRINNGALDNAAGIATLLEAASVLSAMPTPRRSVMFLAVTAEEKGLLGAQYFAQFPTVPAENIVANVNLDMPILTYDFTDVIVFGASRSTIIDAVESATGEMGITLSPDPMPEQGLFTRSDHFRFVEAGIPSVYLIPGLAGEGEAAFAEHMANNYHRPSDDMSEPIDFDAGAKFAEMKARIALTLANGDDRPLWRSGDFFAVTFDGPQEAVSAN
ncbi:MAG: M28 family metallopeptidase [Pseudomonadota bacterium]